MVFILIERGARVEKVEGEKFLRWLLQRPGLITQTLGFHLPLSVTVLFPPRRSLVSAVPKRRIYGGTRNNPQESRDLFFFPSVTRDPVRATASWTRVRAPRVPHPGSLERHLGETDLQKEAFCSVETNPRLIGKEDTLSISWTIVVFRKV